MPSRAELCRALAHAAFSFFFHCTTERQNDTNSLLKPPHRGQADIDIQLLNNVASIHKNRGVRCNVEGAMYLASVEKQTEMRVKTNKLKSRKRGVNVSRPRHVLTYVTGSELVVSSTPWPCLAPSPRGRCRRLRARLLAAADRRALFAARLGE